MKRSRYLVIAALMLCVIAAFGMCFSVFSGTKDNTDLPITPARTSEIILHRTGYTSSYNTETKQPNWVAWHLTKEHVQGTIRRASNAWHEDTDVPKPRVNSYDYKGTGWSRGHMCPAGDNKWNRDAMYETFLYSNVCPNDYCRLSAFRIFALPRAEILSTRSYSKLPKRFMGMSTNTSGL